MKAFISGGAGFIGGSMTDRILLGPQNTVTIFDNLSWGRTDFLPQDLSNSRIKLISGDLLDQDSVIEAVRGHDVVYHFASNPNIAKGASDTSLDLKHSILATYNLLEAMRIADVKKLIFTSGSGVYGDVGHTATAEDFGPLLPISMYGAGKLGAEALISAFSHMFAIKSYIVRLANVVGGRQTHGVALDFINKLVRDPTRLLVLGDGRQSKSYIHIDDVLNAIFFLEAMADEPINVYNVATDDAIDVDWIARAVIEAMGLTGTAIEHTGGERGWPGDVPVVRLDTAKIHRLGWQPRYSSEEAMTLSIQQILYRMNLAPAR